MADCNIQEITPCRSKYHRVDDIESQALTMTCTASGEDVDSLVLGTRLCLRQCGSPITKRINQFYRKAK